jgi:hypothetical protein
MKSLDFQFWDAFFDEGEDNASINGKIETLLRRGHIPDGRNCGYGPCFASSSGDLFSTLTEEQRSVALQIVSAVEAIDHLTGDASLMFLQRSARTGKAFTAREILAELPKGGNRVLICGSA